MVFLFYLRRLFYKVIGWARFGYHIEIEGDPRKIKIGKGTYVENGVQFRVIKGRIEIGNNCVIRRGVIVSTEGGNISIGDDSSINPYCVIYGDGNCRIGNSVRIAAHTVVVPANHNYKNRDVLIKDQGIAKKGILIEDDVWIGAGVVVLDGVKISRGGIVGAGAVVSKELPEYAISLGVPAKVVDYRV